MNEAELWIENVVESASGLAAELPAREADLQIDDDAEMEDIGLSKTQSKKQRRSKSEAAKREASITRGHSALAIHLRVVFTPETAVKAAMKIERQGREAGWAVLEKANNRKSVHLVKWMNTGKKRMGTHYCR